MAKTRLVKGNILCGSQNPGKTQSLRYIDGKEQPNYPVPAIPKHLDLIAGEPMIAWEDFKAIGWHGRVR